MDDERLSADVRTSLRGLEAGAEPRPAFVAALHDDLAVRLGLAAPRSATLARRGAALHPSVVTGRRLVRRLALVAAIVTLVAGAVANAAVIGSLVDRVVHPPSLLDTIRREGGVSIAIRPDGPQVLAPGGRLAGFDVDVARAVAARLGVSADLLPLDVTEILGGEGGWQVGLPSGQVPSGDASRFLATAPYYRWPSYVVTRAGAGAPTSVAALDGGTVCVVAGTAGRSWLDGVTEASGRVTLVPAPTAAVRVLADDQACVADVLGGRSDALVTAAMLPTDVATNPRLALIGDGPVAGEDRVMLVPANVPGAAMLRDELDRILDGLRTDGTLADLARSRFGGDDVPVTAP